MIILYLIIIVLFIIILYLIQQIKKLKSNNKKLLEFNNELNNYIDECRIFKHNLNNKLIAIKNLDNGKINNLIEEIINTEPKAVNNNIYNLPSGIKGLVVEKLYNTKNEVLVNNKINGNPFEKMSAKEFNSIIESLGIALDNAIEATRNIKNSFIIIDLTETNDSLYIKVGNNFSNHINLNRLGDKYYSTKKDSRGLGLYSICKNNLINEKIDIINNIYYITLEMKKVH